MGWGQKNARFYGTLRGQTNNMVGRCGDRGGMLITAQSHSGDIRIQTYVSSIENEDCVRIVACAHTTKATDGHGGGHSVVLYDGPINRLLKENKDLLHLLAEDAFRKECDYDGALCSAGGEYHR
jgi:hypothetical protein